jgi:hypothetical protein
MIEPPKLFTHERLICDIREIESLAMVILDLSLPIDRFLCESFERLVELAGTRDFLLAFSQLQDYMHQLKWKQKTINDSQLIVPSHSLTELNFWLHQTEDKMDSPCFSLTTMQNKEDLIHLNDELSGYSSLETVPLVPYSEFQTAKKSCLKSKINSSTANVTSKYRKHYRQNKKNEKVV